LLIVLMVINHPERMLFYALMATLGSVAGCLALYYVGRKGGSALLEKRFKASHVDGAKKMLQKFGLLVVVVPALLPPPAPFKIFVLLAGVAGVPLWQFAAGVFIARFLRYGAEGVLAVYYGEAAGAYLQAHAKEAGLVLAGLALLVGPDALRSGSGSDAYGALVLVLASLSWAAGSLYTKFAPRATSATVGTGTQMLAGGLALLIAAIVAGEPSRLDLAHASTSSLVAFAYLLTFGSLIGFTAYVYLLAHTTAAKAATYAYVNPVVAVLLGWAIGHEPVTSRTILAAAVILGGVAIITITRDAAPVTRVGR